MKKVIGIRREDKSPWEKRTPLIPAHVRELLETLPLEVIIQPSSIRAFSDEEFLREGARVEEDLCPSSIVLAIKEIPVPLIQDGKAYVFFSHTIKGQPQNMPMLQRFVEGRCTLIDYEKIVDDNGNRLIFFGRQAGQAGMIDTLWALGQRLFQEGYQTPLAGILQTCRYRSMVEAKEEIQKAGREILEKGLDSGLSPLVIGIMGYGHSSRGAQDILSLLPCEEVSPFDLETLCGRGGSSSNRIYKAVFREEHLVVPRSPGAFFLLQDYYDHPQNYVSRFDAFLPYLTAIVNCIYWAPRYPRFVTRDSLRTLFGRPAGPRLRVLGDITCDIRGSMESTVKTMTPENPVYVYDAEADISRDGFQGNGPVVLAVDNLPAEMPLESSVFFSRILKNFVPGLATADFSGNFSNCRLPSPIQRAVILYKGEFTPSYDHMRNFLETKREN